VNDASFRPDHCRRADAAEAAAFADMYAAASGPFASAAGLRIEREAGATLLIAPGLPTPMFNRVIGFGTFEPATERSLDALIARFRAAGVSRFWVTLSPAAQPASVPAWLEARGFTPPPRRAWAQMRWDEGPPPAIATTLTVVEAHPEDAAELGHAVATAFEMPSPMAGWLGGMVGRDGWQAYAARREGRIVGGGFVYSLPPLAWLGMGSILPGFRGDNGQLALFSARIAHAQSEGCSFIHTETGEPVGDEPNPSLANMARYGFRRVASRRNYAWAPPS